MGAILAGTTTLSQVYNNSGKFTKTTLLFCRLRRSLAMKRTERDCIFASASTIQQLIDYGRDAISEWEQAGKITEGIHFIKVATHRRYVVELMVDRLVNWDDDQAHQRAIHNWLLRLPSNHPLPKVGKSAASK
jgi:hypothetical protein